MSWGGDGGDESGWRYGPPEAPGALTEGSRLWDIPAHGQIGLKRAAGSEQGCLPAITTPHGFLHPVEEGLHRAGGVTTASSSKENAGRAETVPFPTRAWQAQPWQATGGRDKSEARIVHGGWRSGRVTRNGDRARPPSSMESCSRRRPGSAQKAAANQQAFSGREMT